jgi:ABC-type transport system involved in multi-copper enzyme maturation permease subunit
MTSWLGLWLIGAVLAAVPLLAALPWLAAADWDLFKALARKPANWGRALAGLAGAGLVLALFLAGVQDRERLQVWGRAYGSALQLLFSADLFVVAFLLLLAAWPRGGAVALAAFREGIRQPLFWLMAGGAAFLMVALLIVPFFTFGDDFRMMKVLDLEIVVAATTLFVVVTASTSISDEIEGRTAVTLLSKPLSRRQFLLGKFGGILLAGLAVASLAGWWLNWALYVKPLLDPNEMVDPLQEQLEPQVMAFARSLTSQREAAAFLEGAGAWWGSALAVLPGLMIGAGQAMLFLAITCALATRLPMIVNLLTCLVIFFLGNLAPRLSQIVLSQQYAHLREHGSENAALGLVQFIARLFSLVLPALEYFGLDSAIVRDQALPVGPYIGHAGLVLGYSVLYSAIALLLGLILFEDRDLA